MNRRWPSWQGVCWHSVQLQKRVAAGSLAILPASVRLWVLRRLFESLTWTTPRRAAIRLLNLELSLREQINATAIRIGHGVHPKHAWTQAAAFFLQHLTAEDIVVDGGCGTGWMAATISDTIGCRVYALDTNLASLATATTTYRTHQGRNALRLPSQVPRMNLFFLAGDVEAVGRWSGPPLTPQQSCDWGSVLLSHVTVLLLADVLEHLPHRVETLRAWKARYPALRFLLRVPCADADWRQRFRQELGLFWMSDATHFTEYTEASLRQELTEAGLTITDLERRWGSLWVEAR